jgi:hypothetical protein
MDLTIFFENALSVTGHWFIVIASPRRLMRLGGAGVETSGQHLSRRAVAALDQGEERAASGVQPGDGGILVRGRRNRNGKSETGQTSKVFGPNISLCPSGKGRSQMLTERFNERTIANMEVALERACLLLPIGSEKHRLRRLIANKIIECANRGDTTLSRLTEAGYAAAKQVAGPSSLMPSKANRRTSACAEPTGIRPGDEQF